jgi:uncharacterized membrane protein YeaQ/YmgE (transglycosylase-associated protein family)
VPWFLLIEQNLLWVLLTGMAAGWLAGQIMKGSGFGRLGSVLVGIIGSVLGNFVVSLTALAAFGFWARIIMAAFSAVLLLTLLSFVRK